jgi:hypothetical protein
LYRCNEGLQIERDGVQLMKPMPDLADLLAKCGGDTKATTTVTPTATATSPEGGSSAAAAAAAAAAAVGEIKLLQGLITIVHVCSSLN